MHRDSEGTLEEADARADQHATVNSLQDQLQVQEAELRRLKSELARETAERAQLEGTLRESEEHFRLLVEHSHDVVYAVAPDGIVTYMSPHFAYYGYSPEEIVSKHFIGFVAPEQRQRVIESFDTGTQAGTSHPTVFQWLKKDGSRVWVEVVGNTIFDDSGQPVQQVGVMRDINERKLQEERMHSLELLLESLDAECFVKDQDGIYQYINRAYERQFCVKREDVIGKDDGFVFGEETGAMLRENDQRIMASGKTESVEEATYLQGEKYIVYFTVKTPITDSDGNVVGMCGVGIDITHQKRIEEELRESEEKYRHLVERISDVIYAIDTTGEITYVSPSVEPFLGYSPAEIEGRPFTEIIAPEDVQRTRESFQKLATGTEPGPNEYRVVTKAGEVRWMRASSQPIVDGEQLSGVQGVMTDITDRVLAESQREAALEALRESEERWRSLTETSPDHILVLDADLNIQFANFASPGLTVDDLIGTPLYTYVEEERQAQVRAILDGVLKTGDDASYETVYDNPDGTVINYESSVAPRRMPGNNEIVGLTVSARDITDRVRAEAQLERAAAAAERERLARDLHDSVTQTLFSIAAIAEVLPDMWERDPTKARRGLHDLKQQTQGALAEMRSLLLAWRPEALQGQDLGDLVHQLGDAMAARTRMPVTVTVVGECDPPAEVALSLYRIAQEALNNVVKHAGASRAIVRLQCTGEGITLSIRDDGRGFDPDGVAPHPLGLSIMRERAEAIGANFAIASEPGGGTKISVTWQDAGQAPDEGRKTKDE